MPPSGEPVKEQLLANLETTLAAIVEGADYYTTVRKVLRLDAAAPEINAFPAIVIVPIGTRYDNQRSQVVGAVAALYTVQLTLLVRTATDVATTIERFIRDVHKALFVDITRGGPAINTRVVSDEIFYPSDAREPIGGADLEVAIDFRTPRSNFNTHQT